MGGHVSFCLSTSGHGCVTTILGVIAAPDPLDNYQYHCKLLQLPRLHCNTHQFADITVCVYLPPEARRNSAIFLFMELAFDTLIFVLTICRTTYMHITNLPATMGDRSSSLIDNLIRDGALYWA